MLHLSKAIYDFDRLNKDKTPYRIDPAQKENNLRIKPLILIFKV